MAEVFAIPLLSHALVMPIKFKASGKEKAVRAVNLDISARAAMKNAPEELAGCATATVLATMASPVTASVHVSATQRLGSGPKVLAAQTVPLTTSVVNVKLPASAMLVARYVVDMALAARVSVAMAAAPVPIHSQWTPPGFVPTAFLASFPSHVLPVATTRPNLVRTSQCAVASVAAMTAFLALACARATQAVVVTGANTTVLWRTAPPVVAMVFALSLDAPATRIGLGIPSVLVLSVIRHVSVLTALASVLTALQVSAATAPLATALAYVPEATGDLIAVVSALGVQALLAATTAFAPRRMVPAPATLTLTTASGLAMHAPLAIPATCRLTAVFDVRVEPTTLLAQVVLVVGMALAANANRKRVTSSTCTAVSLAKLAV